jgi:hypothetical protein
VTRQLPRRAETLDAFLETAQKIVAISAFRRADFGKAHFLEIGSGRDLAVAVALRMLGVAKISCTDITRLAKLPLIEHAARHFAARLSMPAPKLQDWQQLRAFGIEYLAPFDLRTAAIGSGSIDCFYSVDTLEHIPAHDLSQVLKQTRLMLKSNGCSIHMIDYSDHYARGQELSRLNFLRFSDMEWERFNSPLQYVNRLRHSEYLAMFKTAGFSVSRAETDREAPDADVIDHLAPRFEAFDLADLCTVRAMLLLKPAVQGLDAGLNPVHPC